MTSITAGLDALIERIVENDRRLARRTGEHIDRMQAGLKEIQIEDEHKAVLALPPSKADAFKGMTDRQLRSLLTSYKIKGRGRKGLKKADRVALLVEHNVPALSYDFLLNSYLQSSTK